MNNLKEKSGAATPEKTRMDDKKSVNTKVNPLINFQIGLIAALVAAFLIMELSTGRTLNKLPEKKKVAQIQPTGFIGEFVKVPNEEPKPKVKQKEAPKAKVVKTDPNKAPVVVKNEAPDIPDSKVEPISTITAEPLSKGSSTSGSDSKSKPTPVKTQILASVHEVPLFPGCNAGMNRAERVDCLNDKMARFVQRKFDTRLGRTLDSKDVVKISVMFTIGVDGLPKDIQVKAPNKELKDEAFKVISRLPKMTPGKIDNMPVNVTYALPIMFKVYD
ncbi:protein TonB [Nonlabens dokdonensis]|jgi:protein TonB|uniref:Protein TonB n=2 Tax=Nonlabens dokdonensis TaxID=328515 RepID=A0ABX5Q1F5_9FLAO|nr:energy transducer TonB [Nonlabens dokdonensis]AGC76198.1 putative TonB family protein [Nonlabens dokdonensis DSW-6]PZX43867.1 protein TonB [Nonlabens dokdonensis]